MYPTSAEKPKRRISIDSGTYSYSAKMLKHRISLDSETYSQSAKIPKRRMVGLTRMGTNINYLTIYIDSG